MKTIWLLFIISLIFFIGCDSSKSPSDVVKDLYSAANEGKYSDAEKLFSQETLNAIKGLLGQMGGGLKGICDENTKNGSITRVEILKEEIRGEGATVIARIYFKDNTTKENDKTSLIKEKGIWKITF